MIRSAAIGIAATVALASAGCATSYGRTEGDVVFAQYSPLSRNAEIARRVLPPLTYRRFAQTLAVGSQRLAEQAIDLAKERFDLYVPSGPPPAGGYGLLVYISPTAAPTRPRAWRGALDRHHMIFVAAQDAGNAATTLDRRLPLALLAYANVRAQFAIDERRVYVAGLSGGSRVAEIAAMAYPDVFRGAILNAGSDPIDGQAGIYKPAAPLFQAFQRSRVVFITGDKDEGNLLQDDISRRSMRESCVLDVATESVFELGHEALDPVGFERALDALEAPHAIDTAELARCNAHVQRELAARLADAAAAIDRGDRSGARSQILAIEARFGGLAAPAIVELDARLAALP